MSHHGLIDRGAEGRFTSLDTLRKDTQPGLSNIGLAEAKSNIEIRILLDPRATLLTTEVFDGSK
jgi:hypothetical protein